MCTASSSPPPPAPPPASHTGDSTPVYEYDSGGHVCVCLQHPGCRPAALPPSQHISRLTSDQIRDSPHQQYSLNSPHIAPYFSTIASYIAPISKLKNTIMSSEIECVNWRIKYSFSKSGANTKFYQSSTDFISYKSFLINDIKISLPYFVADSVFQR